MPPPGRLPPLARPPAPAAARVLLALLAGLLLAAPAAAQTEPAAEATGEEQAGAVVLTARVFSGGGRDQVRYADVTVIALDEGGAEVASGATGEGGAVDLELPAAGSYTLTVDPATLPADYADLAVEVPVEVTSSRSQLINLDQFGEGAGPAAGGTSSSRLSRIPQLFLDGIKLGSIIAITAIGLSLIFGTTGLVNFAHGELVTFGAVVAWFFNASAGGPTIHLVLAAIPAILIGALAGSGLERGVWAPLRRRGTSLIAMLVISIGLSFIIRNVILIAFGGGTRPYLDYNIQGAITVLGISITPRDLSIIGLSFVVLVAVGLMLQRTRIGKALRAVADNRDLAESSGIDVDRVIRFVWLLGGGLAAYGGVLLGSTEQVNVNMGFNLLLLMFAGVILGGLGTAYGAMVGSLIVGIVSQVSTAFVSAQLKYVWALLILIVVLLVRPQGLLGRAERFG